MSTRPRRAGGAPVPTVADTEPPSSSGDFGSDEGEDNLAEAVFDDDGWSAGDYVTADVCLERPLAEGGMGTVWVARDEGRDRAVAVKLVASSLIQRRPSVAKRFEREAATLARLRHPHVVEIYDYGVSARGNPFIVMELLAGRTLRRRIKVDGPMPPEDVAVWLEQIGDALKAAHELGIIHRDIKPENIVLVDEAPIVAKLLDFGIAKETDVPAVSAVTVTGMMIGTPHFMSPEQLLEPKGIDFRTDLWSLGVCAYVALTGRRPFKGDTLAKLFDAITNRPVRPPSQRRPELGAEVDAWFERALARDVHERFPTAHEMVMEFRRAIQPGTVGTLAAAVELETEVPRVGPNTDEIPWLTPPPPEARARMVTAAPGVVGRREEGSNTPASAPSAGRPRSGITPAPLGEEAEGGFEIAGLHLSNRLLGTVVLLVVAVAGGLASARWWRKQQRLRAVPETMQPVPAGRLTMGCVADVACEPDEFPAHEVELAAFDLDATEVTVTRYRACVEAGGCNREGFEAPDCTWGRADGELPINCVSVAQAERYCSYLGARLPTEAEWERAARGDDTRRYPWGNGPPTCDGVAVAVATSGRCPRSGPSPVGVANGAGPFGHRDLAGNVREWTADAYDPEAYRRTGSPPPTTRRTVRGGGWRGGPASVRVTHREGLDPAVHDASVGFRCARDAVR
ncbi:MAG: bifunctional serine/threonine-protein kinase/formylglycine-generating enzyme family protein [Myxococcota bacterium]